MLIVQDFSARALTSAYCVRQSDDGKLKILAAQTKDYSVHDKDITLHEVAIMLRGQPTTGAELGAIVSTAYGMRRCLPCRVFHSHHEAISFNLRDVCAMLRDCSGQKDSSPGGDGHVSAFDDTQQCIMRAPFHRGQ